MQGKSRYGGEDIFYFAYISLKVSSADVKKKFFGGFITTDISNNLLMRPKKKNKFTSTCLPDGYGSK